MPLRNRKNYVLMSFTLYGVFFLLFGLLGFLLYPEMAGADDFSLWLRLGRLPTAIGMGLLAAWGFGGMAGGFYLVFRYIGGQSTRFKVLSCVLFFVPVWAAMLIGMVGAVPYAVYNLVCLRRGKWSGEPEPEGQPGPGERTRPGGRQSYAPLSFFRDTSLIYYLAGLWIIVLLIVLMDRGVSAVLLLFCALAGVVLLAVLTGRRANRRMEAIMDILRRDCDPERFVRALEDILPRQRRSGNRNYLLLQLCAGYLYLGQPERAGEYLRRADPVMDGQGWNDLKGVYMVHSIICHLDCGELDEAEAALALLREQAMALPPQKAAPYQAHCTAKQYRVNLARGNHSGAAQYFAIQFEQERYPYGRVECKYHQAVAHQLAGEIREAWACLQYVLDSGGELHYVTLARGRLAEIAEGNPGGGIG